MFLTPYAASKVVNSALSESGVDKVLPPQMFYNYVKKGYITSTDGRIHTDDLQVWLVTYLTKNGVTVEVTEQSQFDMSEPS
jgi:hypothetical protein